MNDDFCRMIARRWRWENRIRPCIILAVRVLCVGMLIDSTLRMIEAWM